MFKLKNKKLRQIAHGFTAGVVAFALLIGVSAFPAPAHAAIAVDATSSTQGTADPLTWSHTVSGEDRILVVAVSRGTNSAPSAVTYNGDALTLYVQRGTGLGHKNVSLWYLLSPDTGTNTISVSGGGDKAASAISFTGVGDVGATNTAQTSGGAARSLTVNTTGDDGYVVDAIIFQKVATAAGANQTEFGAQSNFHNDGGDLADHRSSYESYTSSGNPAMQWDSGTSQTTFHAAMEIIEGTQAVATPSGTYMLMGSAF